MKPPEEVWVVVDDGGRAVVSRALDREAAGEEARFWNANYAGIHTVHRYVLAPSIPKEP